MSPAAGKLYHAAQEFADAMRFARSEAMRLREPRGFRQNSTNKRIRVFSVDINTVPWTEIYDVYHPVSKNKYDIRLDAELFAAADSVATVTQYRGTCNQIASVYFDANGIPRCLDPQMVLLDRFEVILKMGDRQQMVSLEAITGQVKIK